MTTQQEPSVERVREALTRAGLETEIITFAVPTKTAKAAAEALGCDVGQIANSLVFRAAQSNRPILCMTSGANRVSEKVLAALVGEEILKADADFVREKTGFAIGGVAPVGHAVAPLTFIDENLFQYDRIWAAAGHPNTVFELTAGDLQRITDGKIAKVTE